MDSVPRRLIQDATRGDAGAMEDLLARCVPDLRSFLRLRVGPQILARESSEDILQSVCREVLQDLPRFEYRGEPSFKRWLFLTAERKIRDRGRFHASHRRSARREQAGDLEQAAACASLLTPSRVASGREQLVAFERAMDALSDEYRQVLTSARVLGMRHDEIAAEIGKSVGAVRQILGRALAKLGRALEEGE